MAPISSAPTAIGKSGHILPLGETKSDRTFVNAIRYRLSRQASPTQIL